jgi:hypothetical protein
MAKPSCTVCSKKTTRECGLCDAPTCKSCAHNIGKEHFRFLLEVPEELSQGYYCNDCFVGKVADMYESYNSTLERAKNMDVYFKKKHSKEVRFFKKSKEIVAIKDCADYDEMILNLAFLAAKEDFNTIINVETTSRKVFDAAYKTILWSGKALPATKNTDYYQD